MNVRVIIIHQSTIIAEGLNRLLQNSPLQLHDHLRMISNPSDISLHNGYKYIFITTSTQFENLYKMHLMHFTETDYRFVQCIHDAATSRHHAASEVLFIDDSYNQVEEKIRNNINSFTQEKNAPMVSLTDRETEVLKLVSLGNASKEIADKLNISTHTVITHRKNITEKLGIKSISGLTVYAILNKIIDTDELSVDDLI